MSIKQSLKDRIKSLEGKITCSRADCQNGLHCFRPNRRKKTNSLVGQCQSCETKAPFEWERLHKCSVEDIEYTVSALKSELIRQYYWTNDIPENVQKYARKKGFVGMEETIEKRIRKYIAPPAGGFDGRQTPIEGSSKVNAVHFAQHATASCCRKCCEYWHGIPAGRTMTENEINYLTQLGMRYIRDRFSLLTELGEHIPPARKKLSL